MGELSGREGLDGGEGATSPLRAEISSASFGRYLTTDKPRENRADSKKGWTQLVKQKTKWHCCNLPASI